MKKCLITILTSVIVLTSFGQNYKDLSYGNTAERNLKLDIYLPENKINPIMVIWIHGGAWHSRSKENPPKYLLKRGYALASVDYRLSEEAPFPAMIHDIKAAIRFLRGNAEKYGYRKDKIVIWGSSAGGHLAALIGVTNGNKDLEGAIGDHTHESSDVNLIIDFYGPTDFKTILAQSTPHGLSVREPALILLLGKSPKEAIHLAMLASPVYYVNASTPPIFIAHGNQDNQVPINQSIELWLKLKEFGVKTEFEILNDMGHGGDGFSENEFMDKVEGFINANLE